MATQSSFVRSILDHDNFIWFISALLSCIVCSVFFVLRHNKLNAAPAMLVHETITHVRFSTPAPPPVSIVQPVVEEPKPEPPKEEKIIPPEPVIEKPKPKLKPKLKPKKKSKKKKTVKPKPLLKKIKVVEKQKTVSQNINPDLHKIVKPSPVAAKVDPRIIEQTRMTYHALLMRHIEVHKNYPRVARKRKIEGKILVSFTLLENGQVKNILVNGKKNILKKASLQAIQNALPMPEAPMELSLPMEVKFNMNYFLVK